MATQIPSAEDVRGRLRGLENGQISELARKSGLAVSTLVNIRDSDAPQGPTVETLRKFWPHLLRMARRPVVRAA